MAISSPSPFQQFFDIDGKVLASGKVYVYKAGSSELLSAYQDAALTTAHANPIILDSYGAETIWLDTTKAYRFVIYDANDKLVKEEDGIVFLNGIIKSFGDIDVNGNSIKTTSNDKNIDIKIYNSGNAISVAGTTNYEDNVTADDDIPNKKKVDDYISTTLVSLDTVSRTWLAHFIITGTGSSTPTVSADPMSVVSSISGYNDQTSYEVFTINFDQSVFPDRTAYDKFCVFPSPRSSSNVDVNVDTITGSTSGPSSVEITVTSQSGSLGAYIIDFMLCGGVE